MFFPFFDRDVYSKQRNSPLVKQSKRLTPLSRNPLISHRLYESVKGGLTHLLNDQSHSKPRPPLFYMLTKFQPNISWAHYHINIWRLPNLEKGLELRGGPTGLMRCPRGSAFSAYGILHVVFLTLEKKAWFRNKRSLRLLSYQPQEILLPQKRF